VNAGDSAKDAAQNQSHWSAGLLWTLWGTNTGHQTINPSSSHLHPRDRGREERLIL